MTLALAPAGTPKAPSPLLRPFLVLVGGTAVAQAIALAASPLVTRLYSPSDFGVFATYGAAVAIAAVATTGCLDRAVPIAPDEAEAGRLSLLALGATLATTLGALALLALTGTAWTAGTPLAPVAPWLVCVAGGAAIAGCHQLATAWATRRQAFPRIARARLTQGLGQVAVQLGAGFAHAGPVGLLAGDLAGRLLGAWVLTAAVPAGDGPREGLRETARRYGRFPALIAPGALLNVLGLQLPTLVLAAFHGPLVLGLFALGQRVIAGPLSLLGEAVGTVYLGAAAALIRDDPRALAGLWATTTRRLALLGTGPIVLIAFGAPPLFPLVFGPAWREAGVYLQWLAPMLWLQFLTNPLGGTLELLERHDLYLVREISRMVLVAGAFGAALFSRADGRGTIALLSAAGVMTYLLYGLLSWLAVRQASTAAMKGAP